MYHRMYIRRCSMSSISEESETGDDEHLDEEFIVCNNNDNDNNHNERKDPSIPSLSVNNCLGDLNAFKEEIREAYEELSTLERQARSKTSPVICPIEQEDELDILLKQLQTLEQRLDQTKMFRNEPIQRPKKFISPSIVAQFDELDQALATLTSTLNNVEIELVDSGNSSSSSAVSDSTTSFVPHQRTDDKHQENEGDEQFSDSGLSQSTDSISLPLKQPSQIRTSSQISNASSVLSCDTLKNSSDNNNNNNQIRLALEKMHEANIKKLFVKIHNEDKSTKNLLIDETMSISDITVLLLHKYHLQPTYAYSLVEELPDLHIYRIFEDHENLIRDAITYWSRDTSNRICFQQHPTKYSMFTEANKFFSIKDKSPEDILSDHISLNTIVLPDDITSTLYIKDKHRKVWKKHACILRQSGIYQLPKSSSSKRDLVCLLKFDSNMHVYHAHNWIESLRAPSEYGFALKYAHIQKKSNKYIHYLCANTFDECQRWINGIRVIQFGMELYQNYQKRKQIVDQGLNNLVKILPNQHRFNFIQSNNKSSAMSESISSISLPINHIISDATKIFLEQDAKNFNSLDRLKISKTNFTRSSSFHDSLRRSTKNTRTCSTSPIKTTESNLKRSKSAKEIASKSQTTTPRSKPSIKFSSTASFIPLINQCIHPERTPTRSSKPPLSPPRRPPPPIPKDQIPFQKLVTIDNHIYDSFQDSPILIPPSRRSCSQTKLQSEDNRTVLKPQLPPMRVTEL